MLRGAMASVASVFALTGTAYAQDVQGNEAFATPEPSAATDANTADRVAYDAAFFGRFNPQTALDMVNQTPNFALNGGDDRRGFSGAVGNLLIDGRRPVAKSQSVQTLLSQIPASQVVRIEVLRGAAVAGDASGQSVLVNVVRVPSAGSGVYDAGFEYNQNRAAPQGDITWSGRNGDVDYGIGGSFYSQWRSLPGYRILYDGAGVETGHVDTPSPRYFREGIVNGNLAFSVLGGRLTTTEQIDIWRFHADNGLNFFDTVNNPLEDLDDNYTEHQWSFEVGANYDRDLGPWTLAAVGLLNRRYYDNNEIDNDTDGAGNLNYLIDSAQHRDSGETILRGALARDFGSAHHFEFGIEGAYNTLDNQLIISEDDGLGPTPLFIPDANVTVEEKRDEAFLSYTWRPDDKWSVETRLAREGSTLTFTGDTNQSVHLEYLKPSIQVSRSFSGGNQLRLRAYRDVGQLNFDDFVSVASIVDNLINGGNPDLKPETAYRLELGGDLQLPLGAAITFSLTHHWIRDAADLVEIVVPDPPNPDIRFDAPGNIGNGWANSFTMHYTMPFSPLIPGAKLTFDGTFWQTRVTDPVTGEHRSISGRPDAQMSGEFRQDLNNLHFSWGLEYQKITEQQYYRHDETDTQEEGPYLDLFVETTLIKGFKLRATAANTLRSPVLRQRNFFTPDRNGAPLRSEHRERQFDDAPWVIVSLSGSF